MNDLVGITTTLGATDFKGLPDQIEFRSFGDAETIEEKRQALRESAKEFEAILDQALSEFALAEGFASPHKKVLEMSAKKPPGPIKSASTATRSPFSISRFPASWYHGFVRGPELSSRVSMYSPPSSALV